MTAKKEHRNTYLILANVVSRTLKLQDAVKAASKEQINDINKRALEALSILSK